LEVVQRDRPRVIETFQLHAIGRTFFSGGHADGHVDNDKCEKWQQFHCSLA
jgi:hypothetical protein